MDAALSGFYQIDSRDSEESESIVFL